MLDRAWVVLCMTESHRAMIELQWEPLPRHLHLFREFMPGEVEREIGDPYGGGIAQYEIARDEMVEAIPSLVQQLRALAG
jgi:protein-tyrosine-phosphatase